MMIAVSNEFIKALKENGRLQLELQIKTNTKEFVVTYDDISSLSYSGSATDEKRFHFGRVSACALDITLVDDDKWKGEALKGGIITPFFYVSDLPDRVPLGVFTIEEVYRKPNEYLLRAVDAMVKFDIKWKGIPGVGFPCQASVLLQKICERIKIVYSANNPEFSLLANSEKLLKGMTYRNIISMIAETQGMYATINRAGELELKRIGGEAVYTVDYEDMTDFIPDEDEIRPNSVMIDIKNETYKGEAEGDIKYYIRLTQNNVMLKNKSLKQLTNTLDKLAQYLQGFSYLPCSLETPIGNPALEVGDIINITDKEGNLHKAVVGGLEFNDNFNMRITSAGESIELNNQTYMDGTDNKLNDVLNIDGLPDMNGYNGATLRTDGTIAYWSKSDSSIKEIRPVDGILRLDATLDNGVYFAKDIGSSVSVSVINTNSLLHDSVKDIILLFDAGAKISISWDGTIHPNDDSILNTEPNRYNEYILRCYRCFGTTWVMTRQVF